MDGAESVFRILEKSAWAVGVVVMSGIGLCWKLHCKREVRDSELAKDCAKLVRRYFFWMNLPWVIMGIGCTVGGVQGISEYFRPSRGGFFVLSWWGSFVGVWAWSCYWVCFRGGGEKLAKYEMPWPMFGKLEYLSDPTLIKVMSICVLTGAVALAAVAWMLDISLHAQ